MNGSVAGVGKVLAAEHCLADDVKVSVQPYYKRLGATAVQSHPAPGSSQSPHSVSVQAEPKAVDYVMHTPTLKTDIEARLKRNNCLVSWPESGGGTLELTFMKTSGQACPGLDWASRCQSEVGEFLSEISCETVNVLQEIWNSFKTQVEERAKQLKVLVRYEFDADRCDLNFVGRKDASKQFKSMVERIKASLEEELRKKQEQISETISTLSRHQLMILGICGYADELGAAAKNVKVVVTQNEVHMTGLADDVKLARLKLFEKMSRLQSDMMTVSQARAALMEKDCVRQHLVECLRHRQVVASWNVRDAELSVFAFTKDQLTSAKEMIQSIVVERELPLDESSKSLMSQPKWKEFAEQLTAEHEMVVMHAGKEGFLVLCCVATCSDVVQAAVKDFIDSNCLVRRLQSMMRPVADLLDRFMSTDLRRIGSKLSECGGDLKRSDGADVEPGFVLVGSRSAVEWASGELVKLVESVAMFDHEIDRPGVPEYLMSTAGAAILSDLQRRHEAVIDLDSSSSSSSSAAAAAAAAASVKYTCKVTLAITPMSYWAALFIYVFNAFRPSVSLSLSLSPNPTTKVVENPKLVRTFPRAGVTGVPVFVSEGWCHG